MPLPPSLEELVVSSVGAESYDTGLDTDGGVPFNGFPAHALRPLAGETRLRLLRVELMHDAADWQHLSGMTQLTTLELPHARSTFTHPPHAVPQHLLLELARQHPALFRLDLSDLAAPHELQEELLQLLPALRQPSALTMAPMDGVPVPAAGA